MNEYPETREHRFLGSQGNLYQYKLVHFSLPLSTMLDPSPPCTRDSLSERHLVHKCATPSY